MTGHKKKIIKNKLYQIKNYIKGHNRMKRQPMKWEKEFVNHGVLLSRLYMDFSNSTITEKSSLKMDKGFE